MLGLLVPWLLPAATAPAFDSALVGCDRADERITAVVNTHLDPSCVYTKGIDITASNVVLDCRGAVLERNDPEDGRETRLGILIEAPADVPLSNIIVRNCTVRGFNNDMRIRRVGAKDLPIEQKYDHPFSDIRVENTHLYDSEASGLFVDAFVSGVTIRNVEVAGAGAVGIYLEGGSKDNVVSRCYIHDNGYGQVTPEGIPIDVGGITFRYLSTGREGIAVDGSRNNRILRNVITRNSAGGIFLYKNCGEDYTQRPNQWWHRPYGSDGNLISGNEISEEENGVWIASRMAENQYFMDCSDPAYLSGPLTAVHLDPARDNVVRRNKFTEVIYGVRIEDDGALVEKNRFTSTDPTHQAIILGTKHRTEVLGQPVDGTTIRSNRSNIDGNAEPYGWIHGHTNTTFLRNRSQNVGVSLGEGVQPPINPFLFAKEIWVEGSR